jgi:hypothetical protein
MTKNPGITMHWNDKKDDGLVFVATYCDEEQEILLVLVEREHIFQTGFRRIDTKYA